MLSADIKSLISWIEDECVADPRPWLPKDVLKLTKLMQELHQSSLEVEQELEGLRHLRNVVAAIAKSNGHLSPAEKARARFEVVAGTDLTSPDQEVPTCD